ncbi:cell wall protein [Micromonospora sp. 15K316]|uniref:major capsid protein n=1 Tax=Micromonospora sp. 15K316 TaxID=2530376 RepID=UPI001052A4E9|nr:major capsid protein [Micromonospora sp. 15K316]TDC31381.1 cell wall protein [Micromonospora sp. 15K316]
MSFEIPEDITALTDDELNQFRAKAVESFQALSSADVVDTGSLDEMRALAKFVEDVRTEQNARVEAARAAAAEIESLAAQVRGDDGSTAADPEPVPETEPSVEPEPDPEPVTASAPAPVNVPARRAALNLATVRQRQPRVLPEPPAPGTQITAAVDVPGFTPGSSIDFDQVTAGIISRANALKTAGGGVGQVISYRHPFQRDLIVTDSSSAPEGTTVAIHASSQRRLPQQDLVASGSWCAPSETLYELVDIACPDMLWDAPEIQMARGGLRYFKPLSLDVAAMTFVHTELDDMNGATKPCYKIPCPAPDEVRCDAVGVCLEAGILTQRHFPELVSWYLRNAMVAHEIRVRQALFQGVLDAATPVTVAQSFGAVGAVYGAVALQAADMIERHNLCDRISLEVVFPWWSRNLFLADIARRNGQNVCDLDPGCIQDLFSTLGVRVQFARGLSPAVPTDIGGPTAADTWPATMQFVIYPAGSLLVGRGEEANLGAIHDSTKFQTNDYTALFTEECVALVDRSVDTRAVTVPICASGETGAQTLAGCPTA